jgi:serine/threonine protein kinase
MTDPKPDIRSIFCEALAYSAPEELARFLDAACLGNAQLRARIEALLEAHGAAGKFLGGPDQAESFMDYLDLDTERPGAVIGPYRLLQQIGEGGMGTVYMAEQTKPVQRKAAIKVIRAGMDSRDCYDKGNQWWQAQRRPPEHLPEMWAMQAETEALLGIDPPPRRVNELPPTNRDKDERPSPTAAEP